MYKFYTLKNLTREELNELALERNVLQDERDKYKQMYEMEKALFIDADLKIERAIEYIDKHIRIDDEYPAYMEMLIEERDELLEILKGDKE